MPHSRHNTGIVKTNLICQKHGHQGTYESMLLNALTLYSIITPLKYVFENIMENGVFAQLEQMLHFHNIFQSIQNLT